MLQAAVFDVKYDCVLKLLLKNSSPVDDFLGHEAITGIAADVTAALEKELAADVTSNARDDDGGSTTASSMTPLAQQATFLSDAGLAGGNVTVVSKRLDVMKGGHLEALEDGQQTAARMVAEGVLLLDGQSRDAALVTSIKTSALTSLSAKKGFVMIFYDVKQSGCDQVMRPAVCKKSDVQRLIGVALQGRSNSTVTDGEQSINDQDVYVLMLGPKVSPQVITSAVFVTGDKRPLTKVATNLSLVYSEDALTSRKTRVRGFMCLDQMEAVACVTAKSVAHLGRRPNKHFEGSTSGSVIMNVNYGQDSCSSTLMVTVWRPNSYWNCRIKDDCAIQAPGEHYKTIKTNV